MKGGLRGVLVGLLCFSMLLGLAVAVFMTPAATASPGWWNSNWTERRCIIVGPHPENFQIMIVIPSDIPKSDYPSIRFLENENSGVLPYWIERHESSYLTQGSYLNVAWVRRLENEASDSTIWMYYRNPSASSAENGDNVFIFFDDFGDNQLDSNKWGKSGTGVDVFDNILRLEDWGDSEGRVEHGPSQGLSTSEQNTRRIIEFRIKNSSTWRGGVRLEGPGWGEKEMWEIFKDDGDFNLFSDGNWGSVNLEGNKWWIGRMTLYAAGKDKITPSIYYGEDNADYRQHVETVSDFSGDWAPDQGGWYFDKYKPKVWDSGGTSSYYFDWFFVRKYAETEPSTEFYFIKECMPDLGQHCQNWCWVGAAANSIYWWSQHGYPELIDDPADPTLNDNRYITDPLLIHPPPPVAPPCPGVYRLLHEIAIDCLYPGWPENMIIIDNTYCHPILDAQYFFGLQEFIDEQGAPLIVHEIVDNSLPWGGTIPPEMGNIVVYRPPTLEDYQRELERCQDVLLWLNFRHYEPYEDTDHVVTGVGFSYDNTWILVSDPWTTGAPDHGNDLYHAPENEPYENLPVLDDDPLWVQYEGQPVQVAKLIFISPEEEEYCGVEVNIENKLLEGLPCEWLEYTISVHNSGNVVDNIILNFEPDGWPDIYIDPPVLIDVLPCEWRQATLYVHVPDNAIGCTYKEITVVAESQFCGATDNDTATAHVQEVCGVEVNIENKLLEGLPCEWLEYTISVHNSGNVVDNIILNFEPDGWPDIYIDPPVLIDVLPCEWRQATLYVHVPDNAIGCTYKEITVIAESEFCHATDEDTATAHVTEVPVCGVEVNIEPEHKRGTPCTWLTFVVRVHNTGNVPDNYLIAVEPDGWPMENIYFETGLPTIRLEDVQPCVTENVFLYVHIPDNALPCTHKEIVVWAESEFCGATDNDNALVQVVSKYLHNTLPGEYPLEPGNWLGTEWHEIYPTYCPYYLLNSWVDTNMDGVVSPGDNIDLMDESEDITWYYVKDVTCTLVLEIEEYSDPDTWWYLEFEDGWDNYCSAWWDPLYTQWNEIRPEFCNRYLLVEWIDGPPYDEMLGYCDWVYLVDKATWEPLPFPLHVVEVVTDLVLCELPEPWTGTVEFSLKNLYTVNVEKILDLNQGSKLVVKFYTYGDGYENENVIETFSPPTHVEENELARHPGPGRVGVKKARLDLTTDDTSNVISTIESFTVCKIMLELRFTQIPLEWALAGTPEEKTELEIEFSEIPLYWALAPEC